MRTMPLTSEQEDSYSTTWPRCYYTSKVFRFRTIVVNMSAGRIPSSRARGTPSPTPDGTTNAIALRRYVFDILLGEAAAASGGMNDGMTFVRIAWPAECFRRVRADVREPISGPRPRWIPLGFPTASPAE